MRPLESFLLKNGLDPIDGTPIHPDPPRKPIDLTPNPKDGLSLKNAKALIRRSKGGRKC